MRLSLRKLRAYSRLPWGEILGNEVDAGVEARWQNAVDRIERSGRPSAQQFSDEEVQNLVEAAERWLALLEPAPSVRAEAAEELAPAVLRHPFDGSLLAAACDLEATVSEWLRWIEAQAVEAEAGRTSAAAVLDHLYRRGPTAAWFTIPASRAVPYYSLGHRQIALAALSAAMPEPAYLSFRVGGVQGFIEQARTAEDYWAGSFVIGFLVQRAASMIVERDNGLGPENLIFPSWRVMESVSDLARGEAKESTSTLSSFPNHFLAIVPAPSGAAFGRLCEEKFKSEWTEFGRIALEKLEVCLGHRGIRVTGHWKDLWSRQFDEQRPPFEIYWTLTPWNLGSTYREIYQQASLDSENRRAVRSFVPIQEPNLKCYLCGTREVLHTRDGSIADFWEQMALLGNGPGEPRALRHRFRPSERLCAVCVTRRLVRLRLGQENEEFYSQFPSTTTVAVAPFVFRVLEAANGADEGAPKLQQALSAFASALQTLSGSFGLKAMARSPYRLPARLEANAIATELHFLLRLDGDWWQESRYEYRSLCAEFGESGSASSQSLVAAAKEALGNVLSAASHLGKPPRYLALLAADCDCVGDWIAGDKLPAWKDSVHPDIAAKVTGRREPGLLSHILMTEALGNLAIAFEHEVSLPGNGTVTIYSGGDDWLGLAPIDGLPLFMDRMAAAAPRSSLCLGDESLLLPGNRVTLSACALVMPHNDPFAGSLKEVGEGLRRWAKEDWGRASGVIAIRRQSGQQTYMGLKWQTAGVRGFQRFNQLLDAFSTQGLSTRFMYQAHLLGNGIHPLTLMSADYLKLFLSTLEERHRVAIHPQLTELFDFFARTAPAAARKQGSWQLMIEALLTARFLTQRSLPARPMPALIVEAAR